MGMWKGIVAQGFMPDLFDVYCHGLQWTAWRPSFVTLHNTYMPNLAQRPSGFTLEHMHGFEKFYRDKGWSAGPHLFVDDHQIWVFTPLIVSGTHSPSWNKLAFGVEMLGDYETEAFDQGRGLAVQKNAVAAIATLSAVVGIDPDKMRLHKEDPATTHNCPGKHVDKAKFIASVKTLMAERHNGEHTLAAAPPDNGEIVSGFPAV